MRSVLFCCKAVSEETDDPICELDISTSIAPNLGPVWNRALASQEGGLEETCKTVESVKKILGVRGMNV